MKIHSPLFPMPAKLFVVFLCIRLVSCSCVTKQQAEEAALNDRISRLLKTLNEEPSKKHLDWTPSVAELINIGPPALLPTLDAFDSEDEFTRLHASRVIAGITAEIMGFDLYEGWESTEAEEKWRRLWTSIGLDAAASSERRRASVSKWRAWSQTQDFNTMKRQIPKRVWNADTAFEQELLGQK